MEGKGKLAFISKYKYPLIVLAVGIMIMLFPSQLVSHETLSDEEMGLTQVLTCTEGVGEAKVIVSENGVVVVCEGANNSKVRFDIIQAIGSYTGFSSDKITVLKMTK